MRTVHKKEIAEETRLDYLSKDAIIGRDANPRPHKELKPPYFPNDLIDLSQGRTMADILEELNKPKEEKVAKKKLFNWI